MSSTTTESRETFPVEVGEITHHNLKQLKLVNSLSFPVKYNDKFYERFLSSEGQCHAKLAYLNDIVVGAICWREEASSQKLAGSSGGQQLYIMTLGVLPAYQRLGVGKRLVNHVLEEAQMKAGTESVYLHVWVKNEAAAAFYRRLGFEEVRIDPQYYKSIQPTAAFVFKKTILPVSTLQTIVPSS